MLVLAKRQCAGHLGEGQIEVAGAIGLPHGLVAAERARDAEFLLPVVGIDEPVSGRRRYQRDAQPYSRTKYILRAGLVSPCGRPECAKHGSVAAIAADRKHR